jgi:hypothetical protein
MWRLFNKLFGRHYVLYRDSATVAVHRVIRLKNNRLMMLCGFSIYTAILEDGGKFKNKGGIWEPLTWDGSLPVVEEE